MAINKALATTDPLIQSNSQKDFQKISLEDLEAFAGVSQPEEKKWTSVFGSVAGYFHEAFCTIARPVNSQST